MNTYAHNNIIIVSDSLSALVATSAPLYGKNIYVDLIKIRYALKLLLQTRDLCSPYLDCVSRVFGAMKWWTKLLKKVCLSTSADKFTTISKNFFRSLVKEENEGSW